MVRSTNAQVSPQQAEPDDDDGMAPACSGSTGSFHARDHHHASGARRGIGVSFLGLGGHGSSAQRRSITDRGPRGSIIESGGDVHAEMAELQKTLASGMEQMEKRMAATEEVLKLRVTQMELAVMGAIKHHIAGSSDGFGSNNTSDHPTPRISHAVTPASNARGSSNMATAAATTSGKGAGSALFDRSSSAMPFGSPRGGDDGKVAGAGGAGSGGGRGGLMGLRQMQGLVERDNEIRSMLGTLRGQVNRTLNKQNTAALMSPDGKPLKPGLFRQASKLRRDGDNNDDDDGRKSLFVRFLRFFGPVMHPDSRFRSFWNATLALLIVYCGVVIPLEISFEDDMFYEMCNTPMATPITSDMRVQCTPFHAFFVFNVIVDVWFMTDVLLNLRTGYMVEGHFVDDDIKAMTHYLKGSFLFDLIGSFPFNFVIQASLTEDVSGESADSNAASRVNRMVRLLRIAKLTKLFRMVKLGAYLEYVEVVIKFNPGLLRVFRLMMTAILCCHWFGCVWWLVSDLEMSDMLNARNQTALDIMADPTFSYALGSDMGDGRLNEWHPPPWIKYSNDLSLKYWHAFYFGAGLALSMVPRDIEPMTTVETFMTCVMMFCGLLLAAFVISSFTSAFASMDSKHALAGKQLDLIRNYLLLKAVPNDLRSRILEYYQYIFTSSQSMEDLKLLQHMPLNLSTQLALSVNAKLISKASFFSEVSDESLAALITVLSPLVFVPGQLLCSEGQRLAMIYFINRGKVQLIKGAGTDDEKVVREIAESDNIGLDDFANSSERRVTLTAKSLTYCDVMSLGTHELTEALEYDATERLRREAERQREEEEKAAKQGSSDKKQRMAACLRKATTVAKMTKLFAGAKADDKAAGAAGAADGGAGSSSLRTSHEGDESEGGGGAAKGGRSFSRRRSAQVTEKPAPTAAPAAATPGVKMSPRPSDEMLRAPSPAAETIETVEAALASGVVPP